MKNDEIYRKAVEKVVENVNSWDDLYKYFDGLAQNVRETESVMAIMHAFFSMYAFIVALRDLPEEGDARVLMERTFRNLLLDGKEKLGFEVAVITPEELQAMAASRMKDLLEAAMSMAPGSQDAPETEAPQGPQGKRTLH